MANDVYKPAPFQDSIGSMYAYPTFIYAKWTSGNTGAVPATLTFDRGIASVTRTGTGAFTIALSSAWDAQLHFRGGVIQASYSNTGACHVQQVEDKVADTTTPEIKILCTNAAGAATDPTNGDVVSFKLEVTPENVGF